MDINETIRETIDQLFRVAEQENPNGYGIINSIGEVRFGKTTYQIQVCLIADKKAWTGENEIKFMEIVKIHD